MSAFDNEIQLILKVYNQAWSRNWGFVPMTEDEFVHTAKDMKQIIDPEMVLIAEHQGTPVGFSLALPNINQALIKLKGRLLPLGLMKLLWHTKVSNKIDSCRLITFGVIPEYQKRGIDSLLYTESVRRGKERGYKWAEMSWILETNDLMCRGCEEMGGVLYKRYRISEMPL
jgi:GNAT superfamily N-acetyltransferase